MVRKAGLVALLACTICLPFLGPQARQAHGGEVERGGVQHSVPPVRIIEIALRIYAGSKWIRIKGRGLTGQIIYERPGRAPLRIDWRVYYGRGAGKGFSRNKRGPRAKVQDTRVRGKNGPRFWIQMRW